MATKTLRNVGITAISSGVPGTHLYLRLDGKDVGPDRGSDIVNCQIGRTTSPAIWRPSS